MTYGGGSAGVTTGLTTWGTGNYGTAGALMPEKYYLNEDNDWDSVSLGNTFGLAIKAGKLYSWGESGSYQTGTGSTNDLYELTQVGSETDWWMVSAGYDHSLGIRKTSDGGGGYNYTLWVWGESAQYATGTGSTTDVQTPTQIGSDIDWEWISAGYQWSCAVKGGKLYTCGINSGYRTGQNTAAGSTTTWTSYDSSTGWTKCFAGRLHGIGIKGGELWGWGEAGFYQFGNNDTTDLLIPTQVDASTNWVDGNCLTDSSLFINSSGELYVAGLNSSGQLGAGATATIATWTQIGTDTDWESVGKGNGNTSINSSSVIKGGKLYASGNNAQGQCGQLPSVASSYDTFQQVGVGTNYVSCSNSLYSSGISLGMAIRKT